MKNRFSGIYAALASAFFLGLAPVFGKMAILYGMSPLAAVALRTILAAFLMLALLLMTNRRYLYIYPVGLIGCLLAGGINGIGSLLFYGSLARIDASVGQLLNSMYPIFLTLWLALDHQPPSRLTLLRIGLSIPAVYLLTQADYAGLDMIGVGMMLGAAALYALHLPINQRVLVDMPAPTVTLYTLLAMSAVVVPAFLFTDSPASLQTVPTNAWWAVGGLTVVTFLSRLTLFMGVKELGGMQTAIIGLSELLVTVFVANIWLDEYLSAEQRLGALLLFTSVLLVGFDKKPPPPKQSEGWLQWLHPRASAALAELPDDLELPNQGEPKQWNSHVTSLP